ncbi:MAG: hypothetical protein R2873_00460 [Caldilineaceae bacterium]
MAICSHLSKLEEWPAMWRSKRVRGQETTDALSHHRLGDALQQYRHVLKAALAL